MDKINSQRGTFGSVQNRFENVIATLQVATENQAAARSRIVDADYAVETSNLSRSQILQQAGNAMVAQANQLPQQVLSLLR
jgi:flagellin